MNEVRVRLIREWTTAADFTDFIRYGYLLQDP